MEKIINKASRKFTAICAYVHTKVMTDGNLWLLIFGSVLITGGMAEFAQAQADFGGANFDQTRLVSAVNFLLGLIEGALGALIMVVAGIAAIFAAAMGAYRAAVGMLVVAVGAFILRALVQLFFGQNFEGSAGLATTN